MTGQLHANTAERPIMATRLCQTYTNSKSPVKSAGHVHSKFNEDLLSFELCATAFCNRNNTRVFSTQHWCVINV